MTDNVITWLAIGLLAYWLWKRSKRATNERRFIVLSGGLGSRQFQPAGGPEPAVAGGVPNIAVVSFPQDGKCPC